MQKLVDSLAPGQTGCLRGTAAAHPFYENVTVANKNTAGSTEADRITIRNYPGEIAKLQGRLLIADTANRITFSGLALDGRDAVDASQPAPSPEIDGDDVQLLDSNVTGGRPGRVPQPRQRPATSPTARVIQRIRVHDCTEGVRAQYSRNLISCATASSTTTTRGACGWARTPTHLRPHNIFDGNQRQVQLSRRRRQLLERQHPQPQHRARTPHRAARTSTRAGTG